MFNLKYLLTLGNWKRATEVKRKGRSYRRGVEHRQHGEERGKWGGFKWGERREDRAEKEVDGKENKH